MTDAAEDRLVSIFPAYALRVRCGDLELRVLREADLPELYALYDEPIFPDPKADYVFGWWKVAEPRRRFNAFQFWAGARASFGMNAWTLQFGVWADGRLVGAQDLNAHSFILTKEVSSGSWLIGQMQGRGYGKLMRQMVLTLAFDHFGAKVARSNAGVHNAASQGVSRSVGYEPDGTQTIIDQLANVVEMQRMRLIPENFRRPAAKVEVTGLHQQLLDSLGVRPEYEPDDSFNPILG